MGRPTIEKMVQQFEEWQKEENQLVSSAEQILTPQQMEKKNNI